MTSSQLCIKQWDISTKHYVYQTLQTTHENELWKTVLKNHNYNPFQSSSCLSIHASFCICCCFIPYLSVLRLYFMFYSLWWQFSLFRDTAPVSQECSIKSHNWMALSSIYGFRYPGKRLNLEWSFKGGFFFPHSRLAKRFCVHCWSQ